MIRVSSPLPPELELLTEKVIGCAVQVHRTLGPGFLESIYRNALCLEFQLNGISFEHEKSVVIRYAGFSVGVHRLDLLVDDAVVIELKAVAGLEAAHSAQVLSYLKATGLRVGLLMNFGAPILKSGLRRFVL